MKSLSDGQLFSLVQQLQSYIGARVQECRTQEKKVAVQFYHYGKVFWWVFDLNVMAPKMLFWPNEKINWKNDKKPLQLFLASHFENSYLHGVEYAVEYGRVLKFKFSRKNYDTLLWEVRLFPHGQNFSVQANEKTLFFNKPRDLEKRVEMEIATETFDWISWSEEFFSSSLKLKTSKVKGKWDAEKEIKKRHKVIEKLQTELSQKYELKPTEVGNRIKSSQCNPLNISEYKFLDKKLSWQQNMQKAFEFAKKNDKKILGTIERIKIIEGEIARIQSGEVLNTSNIKPSKLAEVAKNTKYRSKVFLNSYKAYVGRTAKDNLLLLRNAKPWYLWMHLRDIPGAHLVAEKTKSIGIEDMPLEEMAKFLLRESSGQNYETGVVFTVQVSECRYIRPIKGDKLGRVQVQQEKVYSFTS